MCRETNQMEWERGARRVKLGSDTSTHSVSMLCWSYTDQLRILDSNFHGIFCKDFFLKYLSEEVDIVYSTSELNFVFLSLLPCQYL